MAPRSIEAVDPIVQRLRRLAHESPDLKDLAQVYEAILPLLHDANLHAAPVSLTPDEARAKMEMGLPLLHDLDLELDDQSVCGLMLQLAGAVETLGEKTSPHRCATAARRIRLALEENAVNVSSLLLHIAAGQRGCAISVAQDLQLDPGLVWMLSQNALKPALRTWCHQLTRLAEGIQWLKGYCFVCGAGAALGELQDNNLVKHLRCGQCGADWVFRRMQCLYCGNEDHRTLRYLYREGELERMRVEVCDKCNGYLKVITAFSPAAPEMLPVEDLATLHLDSIAQERGYARVAFSGHLL